MTSFFLAAISTYTTQTEANLMAIHEDLVGGLEQEMMRVTLCNSEKVLHMEITREKPNSEVN